MIIDDIIRKAISRKFLLTAGSIALSAYLSTKGVSPEIIYAILGAAGIGSATIAAEDIANNRKILDNVTQALDIDALRTSQKSTQDR